MHSIVETGYLDVHTYVLTRLHLTFAGLLHRYVVVGLCWIPRLDNKYLVAALFGFSLEFSYHN